MSYNNHSHEETTTQYHQGAAPGWVDYQWAGPAPGSPMSDESTDDTESDQYDSAFTTSATEDEALVTPYGAWVLLPEEHREPTANLPEDDSDQDAPSSGEHSPTTTTYDADVDSAGELTPTAEREDPLHATSAADWANEEYGYGYHTDRNPYDYTDDGSSSYSPSDITSESSASSTSGYAGDH
ncbi:hypothetical protein Q8F55_002917 [Vanrija albida]|uniref:Uncharacterized protein n=1 Tax=Vanrija albida TaxID=181172 RepID=A0ABR3QB21_9TREE